MKIANIFPITNQELYKDEDYVMILAHLVKKGLYHPKNFNTNQHIIMDNGLFEKQQISTKIEDLIEIAKASNIPISEIVVPDAANDALSTKQLLLNNIRAINANPQYTYMYVAQAITYGELEDQIDFINIFYDTRKKMSVGISKLTPLDRGSAEAQRIYRKCKYPIHFLGIKESFKELENVKWIRGCDSSQLAFIDKNNKNFLKGSVKNYVRKGEDIDLEKDCCSSYRLKLYKKKIFKEGII